MIRRTERRHRWLAGVAVCSMAFAACSSSDGAAPGEVTDTTEIERTIAERIEAGVLSGVVREPLPTVDGNPLPSLTDPGAEVEFAAASGEVQVVYFGFTNCPDVCPTTLQDLTVGLRLLDREQPGSSDRVETVMVTVDPDRDLDLLPGYITSFVPDAIAVGTPDLDALQAAAEPFGVSYEVRTLDDGTIEVDHTPFLYAVSDEGELLLSWQFGAHKEDIAADLAILLGRTAQGDLE